MSMRMKNIAAFQSRGRRAYAETAHGTTNASRIIRDAPLDLASCSLVN